jgi:uroporphyrinogen III methyltransferase / synthase
MKNSPVVFKAGTRSSALAQIQTTNALLRIEALLPTVKFDIVTASSPGDRDQTSSLTASPEDFFTQDLDRDVLSGALDCAVHSAKDVPDPVAEGLDWCWLPWRAEPRDALVLRPGVTRVSLPSSPRVGVSSERREAWCREVFPDGEMLPIRGNIESRLAQLDDGDFDAVIIAAAALNRLGLKDRITEWIPLNELRVPDGQGALAITFREGDPRFLRIRSLMVNAVTFMGAGVGSADLCTAAGIAALEYCDVCLHDTLMDPALLQHLPAHAVCLDVGKRSGAHAVPQEETTRLLLEYARRGVRVVRLKGGDPCVFGRLAEEVEALDGLHLPYHVIPGISSLSVMGASAGILMTRRGVSNGFSVMSGRGKGGATSSVGIESRRGLPLVLFMSLSVLPDLLSQLRDDGVADDTPAAIVLEAGSPAEEVLRGRVASIADMLEQVRSQRERPPAGLVVIGEVARFAFSREWGALRGQRVLLTCSDALQPESRRRVIAAGGRPVSLPLIRLQSDPVTGEIVTRANQFDWIVVTSPSSVRCLLGALQEYNVDIRSLPRILACGPGTLRELQAANLVPAAIPAKGYSTEGLLAVAEKRIAKGDRVLRVRSDKAGPALAEALQAQGAVVEDCCLYRNEALPQGELPPCDTIFFASSSAVAAFSGAWGVEVLKGKTVLAIGKPTAKALETSGVEDAIVSKEATVKDAIGCLAADCVNRALGLLGSDDSTAEADRSR